MRLRVRHLVDAAGRVLWPTAWLAGAAVLAAAGSYLTVSATRALGAAGVARASAPGHAQYFNGTSAVGALFSVSGGRLGTHFCTASVIHSPNENLLITAAHCVWQRSASSMVFAPGYHAGAFPHGLWIVRKIFVSTAWAMSQNPNDDVAFLVVGQAGTKIEGHTGAETLGIDEPTGQIATVIGYPDTAGRPITCTARAYGLRPAYRQLVFRCDDYTDGTSGGPFLANVNPRTSTGQVIGVIGGYEGGGRTPEVSYAARFFSQVKDLYKAAVAGSGT
jgi:V8-like Glu-specific endopeptidase